MKSSDGINEDLISGMKKHYPYDFEVFENSFRTKDISFFKEEGFKYRIYIRSTWYVTGDSSTWKQNFSVVIEDIETNETYGYFDWYWPYNYIKKFVKEQLKP